jgi:hypothetical protein
MLFGSPQPKILQDGIRHIQSNLVIEVDEEDEEIAELKAACDNLEAAVERIREVDDPRQENGVCSYDIGLDGPDELDGPDAIPCSHEAIFNHSR